MGWRQAFVLILCLVSPHTYAATITLNSTNFAQVDFGIGGDPFDFSVTPHLLSLVLGGSGSGYTATYELYDGSDLLASYSSTFYGGVLRFWHSDDGPEHVRSFGDEIDKLQDANHAPLYSAAMARYHLQKAYWGIGVTLKIPFGRCLVIYGCAVF